MPTVTSSNLLMANRQAGTTSTSGNLLGRATEATERLLAIALSSSSSSHPEVMATTSQYLYPSNTMSSLVDSAYYTRLHSLTTAADIAYTTTTTTTTTSLLDNRGHEPDLVSSSSLPTPSLYSLDELGHWSTASNYAALIHALLASFSVILVSELGDKTFIITAIMAMKNSRSLVFISSAFALLLMTVLSVGMGVAVTVIPEVYTHYASILLFLLFGLKMLKEAYDMSQRAGNKDNSESEFDEVKRSLEDTDDDIDNDRQPGSPGEGNDSCEPIVDQQQADTSTTTTTKKDDQTTSHNWYSQLRKTLYVAPIVIKVFTMVFVAEWGDRSQISTVILAAREDVIGVFIGSLSGHVFCTGLAVIGGRFVADIISVRTMTLLGGIIFLFFAAFEMLVGPEDQQV